MKFQIRVETVLFVEGRVERFRKKFGTREEREKAKRRDPILFGIFKESRKLYYIGDWVDDYCDLTRKRILPAEIAKTAEVAVSRTEYQSVLNS